MRAFLALALPETVRRPFEALQEALPVGRTVQAENLHPLQVSLDAMEALLARLPGHR